ncbi:MAG: SDR family oxidoreductase [Candidatus Atribacteria bacterium]|nr:MAG: SDR family oxidoreductase [Candidatus Atribacteria bacterium]
MKTIVITGSTRGIGLGLAREFLELGCRVVVSGRIEESVTTVRDTLAQVYGEDRVMGIPCDVSQCDAVQSLWDRAKDAYGPIDIWINNAGISHAQRSPWALTIDRTHAIVDTNILGTLYGARVAMTGMVAQGCGSIYNLEGLGSAGRHVRGTALYGTTKAAIRYFTDALVLEAKGTPVVVGAISPGMVITDLILEGLDKTSPDWPRAKSIFNILADRVETVTPWIARRVLANRKSGARINWLTSFKAFGRFARAPFSKRDLFK